MHGVSLVAPVSQHAQVDKANKSHCVAVQVLYSAHLMQGCSFALHGKAWEDMSTLMPSHEITEPASGKGWGLDQPGQGWAKRKKLDRPTVQTFEYKTHPGLTVAKGISALFYLSGAATCMSALQALQAAVLMSMANIGKA